MIKSSGGCIVLAGGGTAGHVLPHFALLPMLRNRFDRICYIGAHNGVERELVRRENERMGANEKNNGNMARGSTSISYSGANGVLGGTNDVYAGENSLRMGVRGAKIEYFGVTCEKFRRSFSLKNLLIPYKIFKGIGEAKRLLLEIKPAVVFSKGGFAAYPVVRAAGKLGIPVVVHESDITMGLANRLSLKYCQKVCTTFAETAANGNKIFAKGKAAAKGGEKFIHTGSPIRSKIYRGKKEIIENRHNFDGYDKKLAANGGDGGAGGCARRNLLVFGGSLGASAVNDCVRRSVPKLCGEYNIIHICGKGKVVELPYAPTAENSRANSREFSQVHFSQTHSSHAHSSRAHLSHLHYVQIEYAEDIENYLAWADIVISRAGSNALCELMVLKKPALFIPLSTGRGDQIKNAEFLQKCGAAGVLYDKDISVEKSNDNVKAVVRFNSEGLTYAEKSAQGLTGSAKPVENLVDALEDVWRRRDEIIRNIAETQIADGTVKIFDTICGVI